MNSINIAKGINKDIDGRNLYNGIRNLYNNGAYNVRVIDNGEATIEDAHNLFWNLPYMKSVDLSQMNFANCTNLYGAFSYMGNITSVNLGRFNVSNIRDMTYFLNACPNLVDFNCEFVGDSKNLSGSLHFSGLPNISSINLLGLNTSNITYFYMHALQNLKDFDMPLVNQKYNVYSAYYYIGNMHPMTESNVHIRLNFNYQTYINQYMNQAFSYINANVIELRNINTYNWYYGMAYCNINTFILDHLTYLYNGRNMFYNTNINTFVFRNIDNYQIADGYWMFNNGHVNKYVLDNSIAITNMLITANYVDVINSNIKSTIPMGKIQTNIENSKFIGDFSVAGANVQGLSLSNVSYNITNMDNGFSRTFPYVAAEGFEDLDTSNVKRMYNIFYGSNIKYVNNMENWDVSNVEFLSGAFSYSSVQANRISNWNISKVNNIAWMFQNYTGASLQNINLSGWDVSHVTNMFNFAVNSTLGYSNVNLSGWDLGNVHDTASANCGLYYTLYNNGILNISNMKLPAYVSIGNYYSAINPIIYATNLNADNCQYFQVSYDNPNSVIDLSSMNTDNLRTLAVHSNLITTLDLYGKTFNNLSNLAISYCNNLTSLNIDCIRSNTYMTIDVTRCNSLTDINVWSNAKVDYYSYMSTKYQELHNLRNIRIEYAQRPDTSNYNYNYASSFLQTFYNDYNLQSIALLNHKFVGYNSNGWYQFNRYDCFNNCRSLRDLDFSGSLFAIQYSNGQIRQYV